MDNETKDKTINEEENPEKKITESRYKNRYKDFNVLNIGEFITKIRKQKGMSQEDIAKALFIDKRKVSRWETGKSIPEAEIIPRLAEVLDVSIIELFACKEYPQSFINQFETKIKNLKTIKKIELRKKILLIIGILLGIFFGITAIYTFNNYGTVEVYSIKSLDKNFTIKGIYVRARDYQSFNISTLKYIGDNRDNLNIDAYNIEYVLTKSDLKKIFNISDFDTSLNKNITKMNLLETINKTYFNFERKFDFISEKNELFLQIIYHDEKNQKQNISIKLKLLKEYDNKL